MNLYIIIVLILGLYYYVNYSTTIVEQFDTNSCPNILLQKGNKLYLKNTKKGKVPGVNPIIFNNLEEYVEYLDWQKALNIHCPVLYLKREYNTQNDEVFRIRPDIIEFNGGNQNAPPGENLNDISRRGYNIKSELLNNNSITNNAGIDSMYNIQEESNVESKPSDNPMDANWGGVKYTQKHIDKGKYKGNEVSIYVP